MGKLEALLPVSIAGDEKIKAAARAADRELAEIDRNINAVYILSRIDELPEPVLDLLAWQFHVEGFEFARTLEEKRALVKSAIELHRFKGTPYALRRALASVNIEAELREWFQYGGEPYRFRLYLRSQATEETYRVLAGLVFAYKNLRSWLDLVGIHREFSGTVYVYSRLQNGKRYRIVPRFGVRVPPAGIYVGGGMRLVRSLSVSVHSPRLIVPPAGFFAAGVFRRARKTAIGVLHG